MTLREFVAHSLLDPRQSIPVVVYRTNCGRPVAILTSSGRFGSHQVLGVQTAIVVDTKAYVVTYTHPAGTPASEEAANAVEGACYTGANA
jgi:hypothetical protein